MNGKPMPIAVIGAGIAGLCSAIAAAQAGHETVLISPQLAPAALQLPAPQDEAAWDARIYALSAASVNFLEQLGVWHHVDATRCTPVYDMRLVAEGNAQAVALSAYEAQLPDLAQIVESRNVELALWQVFSESAAKGRLQHRAARLASMVPVEGGWRLQLESPHSPATAEGQSLDAQLVIAADGAQSPTRDMAGIAVRSRAYPQQAVVANFECAQSHRDCAHQWFGGLKAAGTHANTGILALLPLPPKRQSSTAQNSELSAEPSGRVWRVSMVWSTSPETAAFLSGLSLPALVAAVNEATNGALELTRCITAPQSFPLRTVSADALVAQRLALVGDAAHVVHPLAGHGLNLGLGDAAALGALLQLPVAREDAGDRALLRRYARSRAEAVFTVAALTDQLFRLFDAPPAPLRWARQLGWQAVAASAPLRKAMAKRATKL